MNKLLARKRSIIETIIDQLKNISQIQAFSSSPVLSILPLMFCIGLLPIVINLKPSLHLE